MDKLRPLIPLFITAGLLIGASGLHSSVISLRAALEGIPTSGIGLISSAYYLGFALGCMHVTSYLRTSGHIRTFAAFAAIASAATILQVMFISPAFWVLLRFVNGYGLAILFTVIESWINARVDNSIRARTLSIYRFVDLASATAFQYLLIIGVAGFNLFGVIAIALALSLVPIALADRSSPSPPDAVKFNLKNVFAISPLACIGGVMVGMSNTVYRSLGPNYSQTLGFSLAEVANFMSVGIIGGIVLQFPLSYLADKVDRRIGIAISAGGGMLASVFLVWLSGSSVAANLIAIMVFGAFSMPLYSLCSAHANDRAGPGQHAMISAGVLFYWGLGAAIGPLCAGALMQWFGPKMLFVFTSFIQGGFVAYTITRIIQRPASSS